LSFQSQTLRQPHNGLALPNVFNEIVPSEDRYAVTQLTDRYNKSISSITELEAGVLTKQKEDATKSLNPSLTKLNWLIQCIPLFLEQQMIR
jgi:hypothetical protein